MDFTSVSMDRYGRTVAHVWRDQVLVNWRQVEDGLAWCFTKYLKSPDVCLLLKQAARAGKKGLWREPSPFAPRPFKELKRSGSPAET